MNRLSSFTEYFTEPTSERDQSTIAKSPSEYKRLHRLHRAAWCAREHLVTAPTAHPAPTSPSTHRTYRTGTCPSRTGSPAQASSGCSHRSDNNAVRSRVPDAESQTHQPEPRVSSDVLPCGRLRVSATTFRERYPSRLRAPHRVIPESRQKWFPARARSVPFQSNRRP